MDTSFVPLRLRSSYSHFAGTLPPGEIPAELERAGFAAAALVDTGNLYGAVDFYEAAERVGIKPIIGAELTCPAHRTMMNREDYAIAFPTDSPYRERINRAMLEMLHTGTYANIVKHWFGTQGQN